jgi:HK97 family phage prohead protease
VRAARRALEYAESIVARLEEENRTLVSVEAKHMAKIETRTNSTKFEIRELDGSNGMTFTGYAAVFDSPSQPLPFTERIAPGAFKRSLAARNDIKLLWNHDTSTILGSTRAGTLRLEEDSIGLRVTADLPDTQAGRDAAYLIRRGDVDSMSFGFSVPKGGDEWVSENERVLRSVRLIETSVVAFPAYESTAGTTSVRGLERVARRAEVDADALADAMLKIESGVDLTPEEAEMFSRVVDELTPDDDSEATKTNDDGINASMLELKKKKLEALLKRI